MSNLADENYLNEFSETLAQIKHMIDAMPGMQTWRLDHYVDSIYNQSRSLIHADDAERLQEFRKIAALCWMGGKSHSRALPKEDDLARKTIEKWLPLMISRRNNLAQDMEERASAQWTNVVNDFYRAIDIDPESRTATGAPVVTEAPAVTRIMTDDGEMID